MGRTDITVHGFRMLMISLVRAQVRMVFSSIRAPFGTGLL
jgi:hypothetical protein